MKRIIPNELQPSGCGFHNPCKGIEIIALRRAQKYIPTQAVANRFVFVKRGEIRLFPNDQTPLRIPENFFLFISSPESPEMEAIKETELVVMNISQMRNTCPEICRPYTQHHCGHSPVEFPGGSCHKATPLLLDFFKLLSKYYRVGIHCMEMYRIKEKELFMLLAKSYSYDEMAAVFFPIFGEMADFKTRAISYARNSHTVSELSSAMGMERGYFQKIFKKEFGIPPYQWMLQQKAGQTLEMLHQKHLPLKIATEQLGFSSQSHLNKFCKEKFGKTAKAMRDEL